MTQKFKLVNPEDIKFNSKKPNNNIRRLLILDGKKLTRVVTQNRS